MECKYCSRVCKNTNSLINHERLCKSNENRQIIKSNFINYNKVKKEKGIKGTNQFIKAKELGLEKPLISQDTKEKISKYRTGKFYTEEQKKNHSDIMKRVVELNPDSYSKNNVVGRVKNIDYNGVKLKGSWEVLVAKWLDSYQIKWGHETRYFEYEWNGVRKYFPDFYLPEYDLYIEVKGYETERDIAKWRSLPNLIVFKLNEIKLIKNNKLDVGYLSPK